MSRRFRPRGVSDSGGKLATTCLVIPADFFCQRLSSLSIRWKHFLKPFAQHDLRHQKRGAYTLALCLDQVHTRACQQIFSAQNRVRQHAIATVDIGTELRRDALLKLRLARIAIGVELGE
jgi:hypothetical protein